MGQEIKVKVRFTGDVVVLVPDQVPVGRRRHLAEKVALARIQAIADGGADTENAEEYAREEYAQNFDLDEELADEEFDCCYTNGAGGEWRIVPEDVDATDCES